MATIKSNEIPQEVMERVKSLDNAMRDFLFYCQIPGDMETNKNKLAVFLSNLAQENVDNMVKTNETVH